MHYIYLAKLHLDMGLRKPKKCIKFDHAATLVRGSNTASKVFIGYMHKLLYVFTDFQVSEMLQWGPKFLHNFIIDYTIGFIIDYTAITS